MLNTATVGLAVTPAVVSTFFSHYLYRDPRRHKPVAHLPYDQGLHLIRAFLDYASKHTVEELQAFTAQWVPHPQWVKVDVVQVPDSQLSRAASLIQDQLGPDGSRQVGGMHWWQWRKAKSPVQAEWIEMKEDYHERKRNGEPGNRVMMYVHGGAYFFGSVDEHRYQIQRHARKLKARAIAPRYRLAPQFPFPCGLQDCLATYLHLLETQEASTIVLAGDSAGAGMVVSMLVILRDRGIPFPAGAVLISPWVDLTHSFPSVSRDCPHDYIPQHGFHHKPSRAWPPADQSIIEKLKASAVSQKKAKAVDDSGSRAREAPTINYVAEKATHLTIDIGGEEVEITEQIQMYTTNELLRHPLVSPVMQPSLGGLPPLLIIVGGGEILRDEQIYLAHKCAHPEQYLPPDDCMDEEDYAQVMQYKPTDVQVQVWDDLCHVAPTLSFTKPAKFMYRSVAQFSAWALARAQRMGIDIMDDDQVSVITSSTSSGRGHERHEENRKSQRNKKGAGLEHARPQQTPNEHAIGKAGDPLPPFKHHMIRQRITRHGVVYPLAPEEELPGCTVNREEVGHFKPGTVGKWLAQKRLWETRFRRERSRVLEELLHERDVGYEVFPEGDVPPPSALAGRRRLGREDAAEKKAKSLGLALWSLWGSKHDEMTVRRERRRESKTRTATAEVLDGQGVRSFQDMEQQVRAKQDASRPSFGPSRSRRRLVVDEWQTGQEEVPYGDTSVPLPTLVPMSAVSAADQGSVSTRYGPDTNVTGKRPVIDGICMPFSLGLEADSASLVTLTSAMDLDPSRQEKQASFSPKSGPVVTTPTHTASGSTMTVDEKRGEDGEVALPIPPPNQPST